MAVLGLCMAPAAHAAAGLYSASDVLGQLDTNRQPTLDQGLTTGKGFRYPVSSTLDSVHHRLFVSDNLRVSVYDLDANDQLQSRYADNVIGQPSLNTNYNVTTQSGFNYTRGVAYDSAHNRLFVSDWFNNRVLVFDLSGGVTNGMNASYVLGQPDFTSHAARTTQDGLNLPDKPLFDVANSRLYVPDGGNQRIVMYDLSGGITNGMNASVVIGQPDFTTASPGVTQNTITSPSGLAVDNARHHLFVSCISRVLVFDTTALANGMNASYVLGQPDFTSVSITTSRDHMYDPKGVAYDNTTNRLYVSDSNNSRILIFDASTLANGQNALNVLGPSDFTTLSPQTSQHGFTGPDGVDIDSAHQRLYVTDSSNHRILIFDTSSITNGMNAVDAIGQTDGNGQPDFTTKGIYNSNPRSDNMSYPQGTIIDHVHHRLFVSDCGWDRILVYNLDAHDTPTDYIADNVIGQPDFATDENVPPTQSRLHCPIGSAYDPTHDRLFASDYAGRVLVYDLSGGITNGMNASYVLGKSDFTTATSVITATADTMAQPTGVLYDPASNYLYAIDDQLHRILVFNLSGSVSNGMSASYVIGQPDFTTQDCAVSQNGLTKPYGLALDSTHHRLFVTDGGNCNGTAASRVLVYDSSAIANGMNASAVLGEPNFTASQDPNTPTRSTVGLPSSLAYDSTNQQLFVSDDNNNRVMVFDVSAVTNGEDAMGVIGQQDFTSNNYDCLVNATDICDPYGVADQFDTANRRLYLSDSSNARVLIFSFAKLADADTVPDGTAGSNYSTALGAYAQGVPTYTVSSGSLPAGLSLNSSTGVLSGTPAASGDSSFSVTLSDNNGDAGTYTDTKAYTLHVAAAANGGGASGSGSSNSTGSSGTGKQLSPSDAATGTESGQPNTVTSLTGANGTDNIVPQSALTPISLDDLGGFTTGGVTLDVREGDHLTYSLTENGTTTAYHVTVTKVATDHIELNFESHDGDVAIRTGEQQSVAVGQGTFKVETRVNSIVDGVARIRFKRVAAHLPQQKPGAQTAPGSSRSPAWYWIVAAVSVAVFLGVGFLKRRLHGRRTRP